MIYLRCLPITSMLSVFALVASLLAGCTGADEKSGSGADAVSGPTINTTVTCAKMRAGQDRNVGDTNTTINVDCPKDSGNVTTPPAAEPS